MPNFTLKLPEDLWRRMRERSDINWAEVAREAFRRVLDEPYIPTTIDELIGSLRKSEEWDKLLCLAIKTELLDQEYVLKNLKVIYPANVEAILEATDALLRQNGIDPNLGGYVGERRVRDLVRDSLILHGVYDKFESDLRSRYEELSWEAKEAAQLFSQYFIEDPLSTVEFSMSTETDGVERALELMLDRSDVSEVIDELIRCGLVLRDLYQSKAYFHEQYVGPEYARQIYVELFAEVEQGIPSYIGDPDLKAFLLWLAKGSLGIKPVRVYEEEKVDEEFQEIKKIVPEASAPFEEALKRLVKKKIVMIDYWPHRRRVGKRKSMPAYWVYKLTPAARRRITLILAKWLAEAYEQLST